MLLARCTISRSGAIKPFFHHGAITGDRYKYMLRYYLLAEFVKQPSNGNFKKSVAFLHYVNPARQCLNHNLPYKVWGRVDRFSGLRVLLICPRWLLSLAYLKYQVFCQILCNSIHLIIRTSQAFASNTDEALQGVFKNVEIEFYS